MKAPGSLVQAQERVHLFQDPFIHGNPLKMALHLYESGTIFMVMASDVMMWDIGMQKSLIWTMLWTMNDSALHRIGWLGAQIAFDKNSIFIEVNT
jgi:hypothetical protein